jgi:two-component system sensor histidine kinase KdpD
MVGLMGEPFWFRHDMTGRGWLARTKAMIFAPFQRLRRRRPNSGDMVPRTSRALDRWTASRSTSWRYFNAVLVVAVAIGVCWMLRPFLQVGSLVLPFLIAVLLTAIAYGLAPSLLASVLSVLAFDFLFLPPLYSLTIAEPDDVLRLVLFALAALIVSNLAAYARAQAVTASKRAEVAESLYRFSRQLTGAVSLREVVSTSLPRLTDMLRAPVLILLPDDGTLAVFPVEYPGETSLTLTGTELAEIKIWLQENLVPGPDTPVRTSPRWLFVPMRTGQGEVGVMAVGREALESLQVPNTEALFGTLADLMAQAIHRINLVDDLTLANRAAEREELHAALLASLSHDLRTPLASVLVAVESLIVHGDAPDSDPREMLARWIRDEARRLDLYIGNLLDMTRLESGLSHDTTSRLDLGDAVSVALDRCARHLSRHRLSIDIAPDLPLLAGDEVLLEHVLFNLLDNAAKYTPPSSLVQVRAFRDRNQVTIEVSDEGDGIRPADLERIFDKFYRGRRQGPRSPGIGLGLSICRGYIEAMDGRIAARNRPDRSGAIFAITLPVPAEEFQLDMNA